MLSSLGKIPTTSAWRFAHGRRLQHRDAAPGDPAEAPRDRGRLRLPRLVETGAARLSQRRRVAVLREVVGRQRSAGEKRLRHAVDARAHRLDEVERQRLAPVRQAMERPHRRIEPRDLRLARRLGRCERVAKRQRRVHRVRRRAPHAAREAKLGGKNAAKAGK